MLDDYESDSEVTKTLGNDENSLSSTTMALLDRLKPSIKANNNDNNIDEHRIKVLFCSRTHSQLSQFVNELRKVEIPSGVSQSGNEEVTKHVSLGSRKNLCINPKVARLSSTVAMNERCLELQQPKIGKDQKCEYLPLKASHEDLNRLDDFKNNVLAEIQDIEDVASLGRKMKLCPYYASRSVISATEVVTLPYPLLLQKSAREALSVSVKDNIVIIDEAHNLTSAISDTMSFMILRSHLELAQQQLLGYCQKFKNKLKGKNRVYIAQIIRVLKSCLARLDVADTSRGIETSLLPSELLSGPGVDQIQPYKLVRYIQESKLVYKVEGYAELIEKQSQSISTQKQSSKEPQPKGVLAEVQKLLLALMNPASEGRFFMLRQDRQLVLKYMLLNPEGHFEEIVQEARTVILAGGTMSPMTDWSEQLFSYIEPERLKTFSFGHVIDKKNVLVQPLCQGPGAIEFDFTFNNRHSERMLTDLGQTIENICAAAPDGVVIFFPSYDYLAFVFEYWERPSGIGSVVTRISTLKRVFQESKETSVDDLLRDYTTAIGTGNGALMLAVVGGKLSEGINFSDKLGRVVVCVGLPYPNVRSAEWKAKSDYIERIRYDRCKNQGLPDHDCRAKAQAASREYADNTTMRAVNQSIGRAIRHKNDFAAIYLIDKRYATPRIQVKLPGWLREGLYNGQKSWKEVEADCRRFFVSKET